MADNAKIGVDIRVSGNSDFTDPEYANKSPYYDLSPDEYIRRKIEVSTTAYTIDLGAFATVTGFAVKNLDATNYVEVEWYHQRGTTASVDLDYADANPDTIAEGGTAALTFVTDGAEVGGYVDVSLAADAANQAIHGPVAIAAEELITFGTNVALTAKTNDTSACTLSWLRKNKERCDAGASSLGGWLVVCNNKIFPGGDIVLKTGTSTVTAEIIIFGT